MGTPNPCAAPQGQASGTGKSFSQHMSNYSLLLFSGAGTCARGQAAVTNQG